ncbi:hypothetical protein RF11_03648 [Thelohanellus kitauei]|uniref:ISXO2-like transposase domain-containing protein n=1 Tax=Thelohanellus kitauei TaxID=669202 RepID=A0A0C2NEG2_THEKT|nr:hypothetical protein RF11_03648 [Thelohanellus kitauei]
MDLEKWDIISLPYRKCLKQKSISKTFLYTAIIGVNKVLQISYLFINGTREVGIIEATVLSSATVKEWTRFIRQLLADNVDLSNTAIGGNEIVVEGMGLAAGIERIEETECFVVEVENRNAKTIKDILCRHILPRTIVYMDMWKAYNQPCNDLGLEHKTVNHSPTLEDPVT